VSQHTAFNPLCPRCLGEMSFESSARADGGLTSLKFRCRATIAPCSRAVEVIATRGPATEFIRNIYPSVMAGRKEFTRVR
jgi:hypothetical protein